MATLPHGMSADELLDACGPAWSAMTDVERERRGPPLPLAPVAHSLAAIADVLSLALQFPFGARTEGLAVLARRWNFGPEAEALAEQLGREEPAPANAGALDTFTTRRERLLAEIADTARRYGVHRSGSAA